MCSLRAPVGKQSADSSNVGTQRWVNKVESRLFLYLQDIFNLKNLGFHTLLDPRVLLMVVRRQSYYTYLALRLWLSMLYSRELFVGTGMA